MATETDSPHAGKTVRCQGVLTDDDGELLTREQQLHPDHPEAPGTIEVEQRCDAELNYDDHGRFVSSPRGDARDRFASSALRFDCPECGNQQYLCPVCTDEDDRSAAGWIDSENERGNYEAIPCHNCNQREVAERRRRGTF